MNRLTSWKGDGSSWNVQDPGVIAAASSSSLKSLKKRLSTLSLTNSRTSVSSRWGSLTGRTTSRALPPYDPEQDVEKARELQNSNKRLSFFSLLRYSTFLDKILMIFGASLALASGVIIPWIFYWIGKLFLNILLDLKCEHYSNYTLKNESHPLYLKDISYDFLMNTGVAAVALFICNYLSWRCFAWAADRQVKKIISTYFEWIIRKDMAWFDTYVDREFSQSMTEDMTKIRAGIGEKLPALIHIISTEIFLTIIAFAFNYKIALSFFILGPLCILLAILGSYADNRKTEEESKAYGKSRELAEEILCGIRTVKIYQGELKELMRFSEYLKAMSKTEYKWILFSSICSMSGCLLIYCIVAAAIHFGSSSIDLVEEDLCRILAQEFVSSSLNSHIKYVYISFPSGPHSFVLVFLAVGSISLHAMDIPYYIKEVRDAQQKAAQVYFLIDWKPRIDNLSEDGKRPKGFAIGRIEINDVGLKYPRNPKNWAIRNISLTIYPGQIMGLVGRQSSGKSSLLKLLLRLYDPCEGQIIFDGHDLQRYNVRWLRSQITLLSQDPIVFPATIEENLRYVKPNATIDEIHDACKIAHVHLKIMGLPNGYQTTITNNCDGYQLNDTDLRKLCVARVLLYKPKIVLLDDPLLNNDEELESIMISSIRLLHSHYSTIIITSSRANALMKLCDHICYFQDGKIQEQGTHLQLLKAEGAYHKMIKETLVVVIESKPKFVSQLMAYKFAKSLRKANKIRDSVSISTLKSSEVTDNSVNEGSKKTSNKYNKQDKIGFGVGGFQRYSFAKAATFNPKKIANMLDKIQGKRQGRDATRNNKILTGSRVRIRNSKPLIHPIKKEDNLSAGHVSVDIAAEINNSTDSHPDVNTAKYNSQMQGNELEKGITEINSAYNTFWNTDNVSIGSQDSQEFWDSYCDKLESLKRNSPMGSWMDMLGLGRLERSWVALGCLSSVILGVGVPCYGLVVGKMFQTSTLSKASEIRDGFDQLSLFFILMGLVLGPAAFCQEMFFSIAGKKMSMRLRSLLFASMLKQDLEWFDSTENDLSVLGSRLARDTDAVQHVLLTTYGVVFQNVTIFVMSVGFAFSMLPQSYYIITLFLLGAAIIMIICTYFARRLIYSQISMMDSRLVETSELSYITVSSIRSCIILGLERYFLTKFRQSLVKPFKYFYFMSEFRCLSGAFARSFPWVIFAVLVYIGFKFTSNSNLTLDKDPHYEYIFTVAGLMIFGLMSIGESLALLTDPEIGKTAARRILNILESEPRLSHTQRNLVIRNYHKNLLPPKIKLVDVDFNYTYNESLEVLRDINLEIQPNSCIAIVGPGKCGKTTLANLILRLMNPTGGTILFDDENIEYINVGCMRRIMATVDQDSGLLYDMTLSENVKFGNNSTNLSDEDVIEATKSSKVHYEILKLKDGYETKVNKLESNIQMYTLKQRLALARALIRNPKILVVDYSSVNNEQDGIMKDAIENAKEGRTVILISEKIEPIRDADVIYVMNHGEIVEYGSDSHLLDLKGLYYNMYTAQRLFEASNQLQLNRKSVEMEEEEMIDILRQKALSSKPTRKSTIAYTKFLSEHMQSLQTDLQDKNRAMKEETAQAEEIETDHLHSIETILKSSPTPPQQQVKEESSNQFTETGHMHSIEANSTSSPKPHQQQVKEKTSNPSTETGNIHSTEANSTSSPKPHQKVKEKSSNPSTETGHMHSIEANSTSSSTPHQQVKEKSSNPSTETAKAKALIKKASKEPKNPNS